MADKETGSKENEKDNISIPHSTGSKCTQVRKSPRQRASNSVRAENKRSGKREGTSEQTANEKWSMKNDTSFGSGSRSELSKESRDHSYKGLEGFVRRFPAAKPLYNAEGFDEYSKQWYCFCIPIVVMTFIMAVINFILGFVLVAVGLHPLVAYTNLFTDIIIGTEIAACFISSIYAFVNLIVVNRASANSYTIMQVIVTAVILTGSICMAVVYRHAADPTVTISTTDNSTSSLLLLAMKLTEYSLNSTSATENYKAGPSSILLFMVFSFITFFVQFVKMVVACRYRLYLIIKLYARKSVIKSMRR